MIRVFIRHWKKENGSWEPFLKEILQKAYGITDPVIERDEWGKPFLKNDPLFFNVSHSGDYLALAVSERPVGIDIEGIRTVKDGMYRKVVQPQEQPLIGADRERDFIRLWTLKESFVKAEGRGLRIPMKEYYFAEEAGKIFVSYGGERKPWNFYIEESLAENYVVSVCGLEKEIRWTTEQGQKMEYEVGDIVKMKKKHPCGSYTWEILRVGADFRLKCTGCGHQVMMERKLVEKNTKEITKNA